MLKLLTGSLLSFALVGSVAGAVERGPGQVKNAYCGEAREASRRAGGETIVKICTATVSGQPGKYLVVYQSIAVRGGVRAAPTLLFQIRREQPARGGVLVTAAQIGYVQNGMAQRVNFVRGVSAQALIEKSETGAPVAMSGEIDGRNFSAGNFRGAIRALGGRR